MPNPFFSIIIPVYKTENFLEECLQLLLNQTFTDFEAIVIDDGSPGVENYLNAQSIFEKTIGIDQRFIFKKELNGGVSLARNLGIDISRGKFILFLDSDDYYLPNHLNSLYQELNHFDEDIWTSTIFYLRDSIPFKVGQNNETIYLPRPVIQQRSKHPNFNKELVFFEFPCPHLVIHRNVIADNRFTSGLYTGEEPDFLFKIYFAFKKTNRKISLAQLQSDQVMYRRHSGSNTSEDKIDKTKNDEKENYTIIYKKVISSKDSTSLQKLIAYMGIIRLNINEDKSTLNKFAKKSFTLISKILSGWYF